MMNVDLIKDPRTVQYENFLSNYHGLPGLNTEGVLEFIPNTPRHFESLDLVLDTHPGFSDLVHSQMNLGDNYKVFPFKESVRIANEIIVNRFNIVDVEVRFLDKSYEGIVVCWVTDIEHNGVNLMVVLENNYKATGALAMYAAARVQVCSNGMFANSKIGRITMDHRKTSGSNGGFYQWQLQWKENVLVFVEGVEARFNSIKIDIDSMIQCKIDEIEVHAGLGWILRNFEKEVQQKPIMNAIRTMFDEENNPHFNGATHTLSVWTLYNTLTNIITNMGARNYVALNEAALKASMGFMAWLKDQRNKAIVIGEAPVQSLPVAPSGFIDVEAEVIDDEPGFSGLNN